MRARISAARACCRWTAAASCVSMAMRVHYKDVQQQQQQEEEHADDRQPQSRHARSITSTFSEPSADGALTSSAAAAAKGAATRQAVTVGTMTKECDHSNAELLEHGCARGC